MDWESYLKHKPFAGETKPSMLRRRIGHDYQSRRIYLITMTVTGRRPLLGRLVGNCDAPPGAPDAPRIELTELGLRVRSCWMAIESHYPEIQVLATQVMPDHLHGILFVRERMEVHMSQAIMGFKTGCNKEYRRLFPSAATMSQQSGPAAQQQQSGPAAQQSTAAQQSGPAAQQSEGLLWNKGFNDHILEHEGELERWFEYLRDNPRRLAIRRAYADYFRVRFDVSAGGLACAAIGNRFLLTYPQRLQVQLSRRLTDEEIDRWVGFFLAEARRGSVLVSPAISRGEKAVMRAAMDAGMPLIFIASYGFTQFSHPGHQYYDACAEGRLLLLAPWPHQNRKVALTRQQCLQLNAIARQVCL